MPIQLRPRDLQDVLHGYGVRRSHGLHADDSLSCGASDASCVQELTEGADGQSPSDYVEPLPGLLALAAASQGANGNISCVVGYSAALGTITPRHPPTDVAPMGQPELTKSCWRQFCNPPEVLILNVGLWQTELTGHALPAFEAIVRAQLLHLAGIDTVVFLLPWRVRQAHKQSSHCL